MAFPKSKRRKITVDGVTYHYVIVPAAAGLTRTMTLRVQRVADGEHFVFRAIDTTYDPGKAVREFVSPISGEVSNDSNGVTPKDVAAAIRGERISGVWQLSPVTGQKQPASMGGVC